MRNGQWHTIEDIMKKSKLSKPRTKEILQFLANYNFIDLDRESRKAKVTPSLIRFLKENQKH